VASLAEMHRVGSIVDALAQQLKVELEGMEQAAANWLHGMNAYDRQAVRGYYTALWLWNRLDQDRWQKAKIALRQQRRAQSTLEVDHIVSWNLWRTKLAAHRAEMETGGAPEQSVIEELIELNAKVNDLGNCMLLEKNFNISKSNRPLKEFLQGVYEFKEGKWTIEEWARALDLGIPLVDSGEAPIEELGELVAARTQKMRSDLEQFVRGTRSRVDVSAD
jgi:hypothetical protein